MWPLLLHAAMTHPMGTRAEIATAIASTTVDPAAQSCDPAVRANAMGVVFRLSYPYEHARAPLYVSLFTERLRPSEDAMGTTAALWGLFLQLPTKQTLYGLTTHVNPNPSAVDACMAQLGLMHSVLEGDNTYLVEPTLNIFQRLLELAPYDTKRLVEPVAVAARIIAFTQHPHEGLRFAALLTVNEFTRCHGLQDGLMSDLFVALRDCLVAVPVVPPASRDAPRSEDLVREAVGRVHSAAGPFTTERVTRMAFCHGRRASAGWYEASPLRGGFRPVPSVATVPSPQRGGYGQTPRLHRYHRTRRRRGCGRRR
jgi:hypothetical protein